MSTLGSINEKALELFDFAQRCQRPDGSIYGTAGQCRKGTPVKSEVKEEPKKKTRVKIDKVSPAKVKKGEENPTPGLFSKGSDVDIFDVDQKAEEWRKENGLNGIPGTVDWKHDRVHVLAHEFLGGPHKINEWIGEDRKGPSPAEETMINMVHRESALRARGDEGLTRNDLKMYFTRDINFLQGRNNIPDNQLNKYFDGTKPNVDKFIAKYEEIKNRPGYDNLLDASHRAFSNAGEFVFKESFMVNGNKIREFLKDPIIREAMKTDGVHEVARLASMAGVLEKDLDLIALAAKLSPAKKEI